MAVMDYAAFKTHLTGFLWKTNDTELVANLDNLIKMANSALHRKLVISRREVTKTISVGAERYLLPADFGHMISLVGGTSSIGVLRSASASQIAADRLITGLAAGASANYRISNDYLELAGSFSSSAPTSFTMTYRTKIPDYSVEDTSWLADDYLDLYTYAVFRHAGPFLREDERVALWKSMYDETLFDVLEDDKFNVSYGGSPLRSSTGRVAP